jgi:hypothetical protein
MDTVCDQILECLRIILSNAKTVILAQYKLEEQDVLFFAKLRNVDDMYGDAVFWYQYAPPVAPWLLYITTNKDQFMYRLFSWLKNHGSGKKFYIGSASLTEANVLAPFIRDRWAAGDFPFTPERIKLPRTGSSQIRE